MEYDVTRKKPRTSSKIKNRYNAKTYRKFQAMIKPELSEQINEYITSEGINKPEFLLRAIDILKKEMQKNPLS